MGYTIVGAAAADIAVQHGADEEISEALGIDVGEGAGDETRLVLNDMGNENALILEGTPEDFLNLAERIRAVALDSPSLNPRATISRTTYTFEVLHLTDQRPQSLEDALLEADHGNAVGAVTREATEPVPDDQVPDALCALGNDGAFFNLEVETSNGGRLVVPTAQTGDCNG